MSENVREIKPIRCPKCDGTKITTEDFWYGYHCLECGENFHFVTARRIKDEKEGR